MIQVIRSTDLRTNRWSGGTTTELFIFPEGSDYKKQDFGFRISTATIETETSTFTSLPGVFRKLMVLEGTLELTHKGFHSTILEPFETDSFCGDWETTSGGKATDFNLMIRDAELNGTIAMLHFGKKSDLPLTAEKHVFIYVYRGEILLNEKESLKKGDAVYFDSDASVRIQGKINAELIYVNIT